MEPTTSIHGLNFIIERFFELNRLSDEATEEARSFVKLLHSRLKSNPLFGYNCRVDIFGSMRSGLWTIYSDVDICVRLGNDDVDISKDDMVKYINQITKIVRALKFARAIPIICRIPIVKFAKNKNGQGLHGDIIFLNEMALYNSDLLNAYSKWDPRFLKLGLFVKKWAALCQIGSGQYAYPSSYAWIIMLIQFLQKTTPPVLPNIQQDFIAEDDDSDVQQTKNGHNTYFHKQVKPNWSENKKTVGELFIEFLDYYSTYDFKNQAVQIHAVEPIMKPKASCLIVVVDPITDERIGCKAREKALFITERMIPNSHKAFTSFAITSKNGSTLNDLDHVLRQFRKTNIGATFPEEREGQREKARLLSLEKKKAAEAAKQANGQSTSTASKAKKSTGANHSPKNPQASAVSNCLPNVDTRETKPSTSSTVDLLTVATAGLSISEENNVKNVYDVLKVQSKTPSKMPKHPATKKSNGKAMSRLEEILYLKDHIPHLQRRLQILENEERNAQQKSKPTRAPKAKSQRNKKAKIDLNLSQQNNNAATNASSGDDNVLQNLVNGLTDELKEPGLEDNFNEVLSGEEQEEYDYKYSR